MQTIIFKNYQPEQFRITTYPDGQRSVDLRRDKIDVKKPVTIKCRIKNFQDLEVLMCLVAALRKHDYYLDEVQFIYLFGMRSDRSFTGDDCNYFRDVLAPIINGMEVPTISVFAPHNSNTLNYIQAETYQLPYLDILRDKFILFGDESAHYIKESVPLDLVCQSSIVGNFKKERVGGEFKLALKKRFEGDFNAVNPIVIIDDLCDAGGTFLAEAKFLREGGIANKLELFIAHGLFTKGIEPLLEHFDRIIVTNSYQDVYHPRVTTIEVI